MVINPEPETKKKISMKGNRIMKVTTVLASFLAAASLNAAVIEQVIVRQQWPWSTDVKVEYMLSGVTSPVDISVKAYNGNVELDSSRLAASMTGDRFGIEEDGVGTIIIDPVKAFGTSKVALANFKVKLSISESAANINEVIYKVFDLTNGDCENITRAQLLNGEKGSVETDFSKLGDGFNSSVSDVLIWTGVTNKPMYKTTHLVMRKIPAKNQSYMMGSPEGEKGRQRESGDQGSETQVRVSFTNDYYVAVFELTQAQYRYIIETSPSCNYTGEDSDFHPAENMTYDYVRGSYSQTGPSGEKINWPKGSHIHEVYPTSVMGKMRSKYQEEFDLPTEALWEYACRAMTTTAFNNGKNLESDSVYESANLQSIAWFVQNNSEATAGNNATHIVGQKAPNAWGLYDMHGNVSEYCLNAAYVWNTNPENLSELIDPPGSAVEKNDANRMHRGGGVRSRAANCRSAARPPSASHIWCGSPGKFIGIRPIFPIK